MLYHILIDNTDTDYNNNVLVMDNVLDKGLAKIQKNLDLSKNEVKEIKDLILAHKPIPEKYELEYLTLDDDDISIPCYNPIILTCVDKEPYKWFGNYASYVMRLWGEDICAEDVYEVERISEVSQDCPKYVRNIKLKDNTTIEITGICVTDQIFD